jgi:glucose/mannose-6-phosphate isomerase
MFMENNMEKLIEGFADQLTQALSIGESAGLSAPTSRISNVLITGLGGSGIGGTIVSEITARDANVPVCVNKDYFLPSWVGSDTLVIVSSYSGNTEETLHAFREAMAKKARIVCVTSGGSVRDIAGENGYDCILLPGGMPPRACLAFSFTQLLFILAHYGVIDNGIIVQLRNAINLIRVRHDEIRKSAQELAGHLYGRIPVIYCPAGWEGVAIRFRQQLNENSKVLAWHHVIPEMNHNELVGWTAKNDALAVMIFRNDNDYERVQRRIEINKEIISRYTDRIFEVYSQGNSTLERALYLIHLGDWASYELARKRNVDAVEVNVIDFLKSSLEKMPFQ